MLIRHSKPGVPQEVAVPILSAVNALSPEKLKQAAEIRKKIEALQKQMKGILVKQVQ
jgi:hypothetical protein